MTSNLFEGYRLGCELWKFVKSLENLMQCLNDKHMDFWCIIPQRGKKEILKRKLGHERLDKL
jgi:hypothetical protein